MFSACFCIGVHYQYLQHISALVCAEFAACFYICLRCEYLQHFYILLQCEYLQCVSLFVVLYLQRISEFGRAVTSSMFLNLVGL